MNIKERIKSYSFWVSLASAIFLVLKVIGQKFGFTVDETLFNDIITSMCSILVILGIIVPPGSTKTNQTSLATTTTEIVSVSNNLTETTNIENTSTTTQTFGEIIAETTSKEEKLLEFDTNYENLEESEVQTQFQFDTSETQPEELQISQSETTIEIDNNFSVSNFSTLKETFSKLLEEEKAKFENPDDFIEVLSLELNKINNNHTTE